MKDIFEILQERKLIFAGSVIDAKVLEELFEMEVNNKNFIWKSFGLKERIKADGYFVTERGCPDGSFRILESAEMADYGDSKLEKNQNSNLKIALILKAHDISALTEAQQKKHRFIQAKAARCAATMQEELLKSDVL